MTDDEYTARLMVWTGAASLELAAERILKSECDSAAAAAQINLDMARELRKMSTPRRFIELLKKVAKDDQV